MSSINNNTKPNHASRAHALLSASTASRWLNCTPSAKLERQYGEKINTVYAQEGTVAHELAELYLRHDLLRSLSDSDFEKGLETIMSNELFSEEMLDTVPIYTDYCTEQFEAAKAGNPYSVAYIEQKLDFSEYVPGGFGTGDYTQISDPLLEIVDLKYGKGVPVYAEWNKQLMLYGLGALRKFDTMYDISEIRLTIVQPRLNNISSWQISVEELLKWAVEELKPKAELAAKGLGELNPGDWCRFCAVKNKCRKLYEQQMEIAKYEFSDPELLTDEEIADVVLRSSQFVKWVNSVVEYAQARAVDENKHWPGLKLVEGVGRRKWIDESQASDIILERFPELTKDSIFNMDLKSITDIEKIVGKKNFTTRLADIVIKVPGKLTLVSEDDKRPAAGIEQAKKDFDDNEN